MQSVELNADFTENGSSTVFEKAECLSLEEITTLRQQVVHLNRNVVELENTVQLKENQLENAHRETERLSLELKKQQRCNRNLKQQLDDERFFYQKEKEHFCEEMQNHKAKCFGSTFKAQQQQQREFEKIHDGLEEENKQLRDELIEKSETTYNLCIKFLRMKHSKDSLRQKLDQLLREHLQVMADMMEKLDEARKELNIIVSEKFQEPLPMSKAKFLQVVQRNSRLVHENATLKMHIQQLTQNVEKLKSEAQKTKTINVDARTIAKLTMQCRRKHNEESTKASAPQSYSENFARQSLPVEKGLNSFSDIQPGVDNSGDAKGPARSCVKKRNRLSEMEIIDIYEKPVELCTERTRSAPEIKQSAGFR
ncbi:uncharacterized protein LOC107272034 isoform X2 [Cephus cinctus]|nr:uncharacterized protein LOC107272034 isoform X2 [Cephus cinctus]